MYPTNLHTNASNVQPTSSSPVTFPPPPRPFSRLPSRHPLTVQPNATVPPRSSSILTPPPSAHPRSLSSFHPPTASSSTTIRAPPPPPLLPPPPPPPNHVPAHGFNASMQAATCLLNPLHVSTSSYPQQPHQQQQQVPNQENGVVHAQFAPFPWAPPPPQVVTELRAATPKLRPATLPPEHQQYQQHQQQTMTHSTATPTTKKLASTLVRVHPSPTEQYPAQAQASTRGQQPVQPAGASGVPSALGMQTRPHQRLMQPHTGAPERMQKHPPSGPAPPSSSPSMQSQAQQQQQQQQQQQYQQQKQEDASMLPPAMAAFQVLQPAKALLEKTWATAMDAVQREIARLNTEHIRSAREQQRLGELLQRCQVERSHALRALQDTKATLRECLTAAQVERGARIHSERALVEMSSQCTCGARTAKKFGMTPQLPPALPPPLPSSNTSSQLLSSPAVALPTPAIEEDRAVAPIPSVVVRELRRGREEETEGGEAESAPKRRKLTPPQPPPPPPLPSPPPVVAPPPTTLSPVAASTPASEAVPTPEVAEVHVGAKETEETAMDVASDVDDQPHESAPTPTSEAVPTPEVAEVVQVAAKETEETAMDVSSDVDDQSHESAPTPVSEAVPTPEVVEVVQVAVKETEETVVDVSSDTDDQPHESVPVPESESESESESTSPEPNLESERTREEATNDLNPLAMTATDDKEVVSAPRKIGIQHILLVYETLGDTLQCRMCLLRKREVDEGTTVATYPVGATYGELVGHCEQEHEAALDALACMTPSDIAEMQQRMQSSR